MVCIGRRFWSLMTSALFLLWTISNHDLEFTRLKSWVLMYEVLRSLCSVFCDQYVWSQCIVCHDNSHTCMKEDQRAVSYIHLITSFHTTQ
jgi:hypothetical protein